MARHGALQWGRKRDNRDPAGFTAGLTNTFKGYTLRNEEYRLAQDLLYMGKANSSDMEFCSLEQHDQHLMN